MNRNFPLQTFSVNELLRYIDCTRTQEFPARIRQQMDRARELGNTECLLFCNPYSPDGRYYTGPLARAVKREVRRRVSPQLKRILARMKERLPKPVNC